MCIPVIPNLGALLLFYADSKFTNSSVSRSRADTAGLMLHVGELRLGEYTIQIRGNKVAGDEIQL